MQLNKSNIERKINIVKQSQSYKDAKKELRGRHRNTLQTDKIYEFKRDVYNAVVREFPSFAKYKVSDLVKNKAPIPYGKDYDYNEIRFYFNPDLVKRDSLDIDGHPDGVYNIIRLLSVGWKYDKKPPVGEWKGKKIIGLRKRAGNNFLKNTIDIYNQRNKKLNIKSELSKRYKEGE